MGGVPAQTTFQLPSYLCGLGYPSLVLECGVREPSPAEHLAPFYQDPAQRIAGLTMSRSLCYLIFPVEALVGLAEGREGCEIGWDEWKKHVVIPYIDQPDLLGICVSGCRLFCITSPGYGPDANMKVYDFSKKGRMEYLGERTNSGLVGVRYLSPTGVCLKLPWDSLDLTSMDGGRDSVTLFIVSVLHLSLVTRLNDAFYVVGKTAKYFPPEDGEGDLHIWSF